MHRNRQHESAPHIGDQAFRNSRPRATLCKKALTFVSNATAWAVVALGLVYWATSAGNLLMKLNVFPMNTSASEVSNRVHKVDRPSSLSFAERWSAVPRPSAVVGGDKNQGEAPRAEKRESIPFSCELAFSRVVTTGNFSTRCIAGLKTSQITGRSES